MTFEQVANYILIPLGVSFVSALLIWIFSQLYSFGARKKINHLLIIMRDECIAFEKYLKYNDYNNALQMTRRIIDKVYEVFITIKPLTYTRRKRKLINVLLNNIYYACHRFTQQEVGYTDDKEKIACCEKMYRHIFVVGYEKTEDGKYPEPWHFQPITSNSAKTLIYLNLYHFKSIRKILKNSFIFDSYPNEVDLLKKYYDDLIDINLFRKGFSQEISKVFFLTSDTISKKDFDKLIKNL